MDLTGLNLKPKKENNTIDLSDLNLKVKKQVNTVDLSDLKLKPKTPATIDLKDLNLKTKSNIIAPATEMINSPIKKLLEKMQTKEPEKIIKAAVEPIEKTTNALQSVILNKQKKQEPPELAIRENTAEPIIRPYSKFDTAKSKTIYQPPDQIEQLADKINILSAGVENLQELDKLKKKQQYVILSADLPVLALTGGMPLSIAAGIEGLKQAKNLVVQKTKGEKYNPLDIRGLSELLPENTNEYTKLGATILESLGDVAILGAGANKAKKILIDDATDETINKLKKAGYKIDDNKINDFKTAVSEKSKDLTIDDAIALNIQTRTAKVPGVNTDIPKNNVSQINKPIKNFTDENTKIQLSDEFINKAKNSSVPDKPYYDFIIKNQDYIEKSPQNLQNVTKKQIMNMLNMIDNKPAKISTPAGDVILQESHIDKLLNKNEVQRSQYFTRAIATLERPNEILKDNNKKIFIKLFDNNGVSPHITIVKVTDDGNFYVTNFPVTFKRKFVKVLEKDRGLNSETLSSPKRQNTINELPNSQELNLSNENITQKFENVNTDNSDNILASPSTTIARNQKAINIGDVKDENFKLSQEVVNILKKHIPKTLLAESSNRKRGTLGTFNRINNNIYVHALNDVLTASHEAVHAVDFGGKYIETIKNQDYINDLQNAYLNEYPGAKNTHPKSKQLHEGLAMVLEKAIEDPKYTEDHYPNAYKMFQINPYLKGFYKDAKILYQKYTNLDGPSKIKARISYESVKTPKGTSKKKFLNIIDKIKTELLDDQYPIYKLAQLARVDKTAKNPYWFTRVNKNIDNIIMQNIDGKSEKYYSFVDGDIKKIYDFNWKTLYNKLKGKVKDFDALLVGRRIYTTDKLLKNLKAKQIELAKNFKNDLELNKDIKTLTEILKNEGVKITEATQTYREYEPIYKYELYIYDKLRSADLNLLHNVHYINDITHTKLESNEGYAPFRREIFNEIIGEDVEQKTIGTGTVDSLKRYKGSELSIISPLNSSIQNHSQIMKIATKQIIKNAIGEIANNIPEIFSKVPVKTATDQTGKIFFPQEKDKNILMAIDKNGKRIAFEVDAGVKASIEECLTIDNIGLVAQIPIFISKIFTKGTTALYPFFALVNVLRDQPTAFVNSTNGYIPFTATTKLFKDIIYNGPAKQYLREYIDLAGTRQTLLGSLNEPIKIEQQINNENKTLTQLLTKSWKSVEDIMSAPANFSEIVTRASEYCLARINGKTIVESLEDAGRITGSFHHIGRWGKGSFGKVWVKSIPYFNATLQVMTRTAEAATDIAGGRSKKFIFSTILLTAAYFAANEMLWENMNEEEKQDFQNLTAQQLALYLYFSNKKDNSMSKIPVPEYFSIIGNILTMIINEKQKRVDYTGKDYLQAITTPIPNQFNLFEPEQMILALTPHIGTIGISALTNKKTYPEVMDIVPQYLQNKEKRMQFNEKTSAFAKWVGNKLNISPILIDYQLSSAFGRTVRLGLNIDDIGQFNPFEQKSYFTSGRIMNRYYTKREGYRGLKNSLQTGARELTEEEIKWISQNAKKYDTRGISKLLSAYNKIARNNREKGIEELSDEQKNIRKQIFETIFND